MFPLVTPLAVQIADGDRDVILHAFATILSGAVFGDHCSPISDTTVLSSIACGCDLQDHVITQMPYALTIGVIGSIFGDLITRGGCPVVVSYLVSIIFVVGIIFLLGTPIPTYAPDDGGLVGAEIDAVSPFEKLIGVTIWSSPPVGGSKETEDDSDFLEKREPNATKE